MRTGANQNQRPIKPLKENQKKGRPNQQEGEKKGMRKSSKRKKKTLQQQKRN